MVLTLKLSGGLCALEVAWRRAGRGWQDLLRALRGARGHALHRPCKARGAGHESLSEPKGPSTALRGVQSRRSPLHSALLKAKECKRVLLKVL